MPHSPGNDQGAEPASERADQPASAAGGQASNQPASAADGQEVDQPDQPTAAADGLQAGQTQTDGAPAKDELSGPGSVSMEPTPNDRVSNLAA